MFSTSLRRLPRNKLFAKPTNLKLYSNSNDYFAAEENSDRKSLPMNTIIKFVPQQEAWVVERMGKFQKILDPGLAFLIPVLDTISYVHTLKEVAIGIPSQNAITGDNVTLSIDGVLYYRIFDAYKASYGIENLEFAISQLAQTTMRSEIGRLTLDRCLAERAALNVNIVEAMNSAAGEWGVKILRYEIKDIHPPNNVVDSMHQQVSAERKKRADILQSEGERQSAINVAEGHKQAQILDSEADKESKINMAKGEAQSILVKAEATAAALEKIAAVISKGKGAEDAVNLKVAEQYLDAFAKIAKESNTVVVPANVGDAASMLTQMMSVMKGFKNTQ